MKRYLLIGAGLALSVLALTACGKTEPTQTTEHIHSFGAWETVNQATCTEPGQQKRVCASCAAEEVENISPLGHVETIDAAVEPTCVETGLTEGKHCDRCGQILQKQETVDKTEHQFGQWVIVTQPACPHSGVAERTCEQCGEKEVEAVPATEHDYVAEVTEPTCTEPGYTTHTCACGDSYTDTEVGALGHDYVEGFCTRCGEQKPSEGLEFELNEQETAYIVTGIGTCTDGKVVVPAQYEGLPVTAIGTGAFADQTTVTAVVLPDSVTEIADYAFLRCTGLTAIRLSQQTETIGYAAFYGCTALGEVALPDSVTTIGGYAFRGCTALEKVSMGHGLKTIEKWAFYGCTALTDIDLGGVEEIGDHAFYNCTVLQHIAIPDSVKTIAYGAFMNCTALEKITIGNGLTYLEENPFDDTAYYADSNNWENGVLYLGNYLLEADSKKLPKDYTIRQGTLCIAEKAFFGCSNLQNLTIPESLHSIGESAFQGCSARKSVTVEGNNLFFKVEGNCLIEIETKTLILGFNNSVIPTDGTVTKIADNAFYQCGTLTELTIPEGVVSIGAYAFSDCTKLTLTIPEGVQTIGYGAFRGCTALKNIQLPESITTIGGEAFYKTGYYNDKSNWENGVLYIGSYLIEADDKAELGDYQIKEGTSVLADSAFSGSAISGVQIPAGIALIPAYAFQQCSSLTEVILPEAVREIGTAAFMNSRALTTVKIGGNVCKIEDYAFSYCTNLTDIYYDGTVEQWNAIDKADYWDYNAGAYTIHCTDGDI